MSNTTPTPTFTGTLTALLALTTPFVPSSGCQQAYDIVTEWGPSTSKNITYTTSVTFLVSEPANSNFSLCQPSQYRPENGQSYSAGVCPSSWLYIEMSTMKVVTTEISVSSAIPVTRTISTAMCCPYSYNYVATTTGPLARLGPFCTHYVETSQSVTKSDGSVQIFSNGTEIHPVKWIAWESADVSTLSPRPPDLTSDMRVPTWFPGMKISKGDYDNNGKGDQRTESEAANAGIKQAALGIGIPAGIIFLIICGCCYWCCHPTAAHKRRKAEAGQAEEAAAARHRDRMTDAPPPCYSQDTEPAPSGFELTERRNERL